MTSEEIKAAIERVRRDEGGLDTELERGLAFYEIALQLAITNEREQRRDEARQRAMLETSR